MKSELSYQIGGWVVKNRAIAYDGLTMKKSLRMARHSTFLGFAFEKEISIPRILICRYVKFTSWELSEPKHDCH